MKMKKLRLPILFLLLIVLFAACSGGGESEPIQPPASARPDSSVTDSNKPASGETAKEFTVAETELYNEDGIIVTATGTDESIFGPEITVMITNNTDKNVTVSARELSVNGFMMSTSGLYADVAAGKKAMDSIDFMSSELEKCGIDTIAELEFYIHISDADSYDTLTESDLITLHTSASEGFTQPIDDSGEVLYDAGGIRIISKGLKQDVFWDGSLVFYVENNAEDSIIVSAENVSVNGFMADEGMWSELRPGTKAIDDMYLMSLEDLQIESIDQIETMEFSLRILDQDDWDEIATTDVITLNFA